MLIIDTYNLYAKIEIQTVGEYHNHDKNRKQTNKNARYQ